MDYHYRACGPAHLGLYFVRSGPARPVVVYVVLAWCAYAGKGDGMIEIPKGFEFPPAPIPASPRWLVRTIDYIQPTFGENVSGGFLAKFYVPKFGVLVQTDILADRNIRRVQFIVNNAIPIHDVAYHHPHVTIRTGDEKSQVGIDLEWYKQFEIRVLTTASEVRFILHTWIPTTGNPQRIIE